MEQNYLCVLFDLCKVQGEMNTGSKKDVETCPRSSNPWKSRTTPHVLFTVYLENLKTDGNAFNDSKQV